MRANPVRPSSLAEKAYVTIRKRILKGEYAQGAPLSRRRIAGEMGVSFIPVSEAFQRLESEGLVESLPRVGTRVRTPAAQDLRDCYIIREALESQAARLFCEKASGAERRELAAMAERLEQMIETGGTGRSERERQYAIQTLHVDFHMRIVECTGCAALVGLVEQRHVLIFNWFYDVTAGAQLAPGRHRELAQVLTGGDPDAAMLAAGRHVRGGLEEIEAGISGRFATMLEEPEPGREEKRAQPWRLRERR